MDQAFAYDPLMTGTKGLVLAKNDIVYVQRYAGTLNKEKFVYFLVARLPAAAKEFIKFGDERTEYMLLSFDDYVQRTDAWPVFQERAVEYANSLSK